MHALPRAFSAFVAVVVLGSLVACAPGPESTPAAERTSTAAPTPESTPEPTPSGPVVAFGGDCSAVVATDALSAAMAEEMYFREPEWADGADAELGGVTCGWAATEYLAGFATVWAYPVDVIEPAFVQSEAANGCSAAQPECVISGVFGGTWVGIRVYSDRAGEQIEALRPALADIGERAAIAESPRPDERQGWWSPLPGCAEVAASLSGDGVPAEANDDRSTAAPQFVGGPISRGCTLDLTVEGHTRQAFVVLRAGAGDAVRSVLDADASARVEHEGRTFAQATEQYPIDGNPGLLIGTDGVNLIELLRADWDGGPTTDAATLAALMTALGG